MAEEKWLELSEHDSELFTKRSKDYVKAKMPLKATFRYCHKVSEIILMVFLCPLCFYGFLFN